MSYVPTQFGPNSGLTGFSSQASFIHFWKKYAQQASGKLGIPYQWILAQWAMETAYGSQPNMGKFNPGNVGNLNGSWQNYSSPSYTVRAGDNLWTIAQSHGLTIHQILRWNSQIKNPNLIYPGEVIKLGG